MQCSPQLLQCSPKSPIDARLFIAFPSANQSGECCNCNCCRALLGISIGAHQSGSQLSRLASPEMVETFSIEAHKTRRNAKPDKLDQEANELRLASRLLRPLVWLVAHLFCRLFMTRRLCRHFTWQIRLVCWPACKHTHTLTLTLTAGQQTSESPEPRDAYCEPDEDAKSCKLNSHTWLDGSEMRLRLRKAQA